MATLATHANHLLALCDKIEAGYAAEKSGFDDDMAPLLIELGDSTDSIRAVLAAQAPAVGALYVSRRDELDCDPDGRDRVTPAGSLWRVVEVAPAFVSIVCDATGGWINPDADELARDFRAVQP